MSEKDIGIEIEQEEKEVKIPEQIAKEEITEQDDAEQYRCYDLTLPGMPIKYISTRSQKINKQVVNIPKYYEVKSGEKTIGYQRWESEEHIQDFGAEQVSGIHVLGQRERGE